MKLFLQKLIRMYQSIISPFFGDHCRFLPSCSEYCLLAVGKYGVVRGLWMGAKRILRCNPWSEGGIDKP